MSYSECGDEIKSLERRVKLPQAAAIPAISEGIVSESIQLSAMSRMPEISMSLRPLLPSGPMRSML